MSKPTIASLTAERDALKAEVLALANTVKELREQIAMLKPVPRAPAAKRYWDEFPDRKAGMEWAKANSGVVCHRPMSREQREQLRDIARAGA